MALPLAGIVNSAAGLVSSLQANSTLCQIQDEGENTLVQFDAVISENYVKPSAPTAYAIEDGRSISDHVQQLPLAITIDAYVTDTPLTDSGSLAAIASGNLSLSNPAIKEGLATAATALLPPLGVAVAGVAASLFTSNSASPSVAAYNKLRGIQLGAKDGAPPQAVKVVSKLGVFDNMFITNITVPRSLETGGGLQFQIELVQVIVVSPQEVPLAAAANPLVSAAQSVAGQKQASPSSAPPSAPNGVIDSSEVNRNIVRGYGDTDSAINALKGN